MRHFVYPLWSAVVCERSKKWRGSNSGKGEGAVSYVCPRVNDSIRLHCRWLRPFEKGTERHNPGLLPHSLLLVELSIRCTFWPDSVYGLIASLHTYVKPYSRFSVTKRSLFSGDGYVQTRKSNTLCKVESSSFSNESRAVSLCTSDFTRVRVWL